MSDSVDTKLRLEILNLLQYVQRLRQEIATVSKREEDQTAFESMSDQLDAIVAATEKATDTILEAMENIGDKVDALRGENAAAARDTLCNQIANETMQVMEACAFQDITGQRVTKIVSSVKFVEERVNAMAELWGREEIEAMMGALPDDKPTGDEALMHGPQLPDDAISQDEIDKLFD